MGPSRCVNFARVFRCYDRNRTTSAHLISIAHSTAPISFWFMSGTTPRLYGASASTGPRPAAHITFFSMTLTTALSPRRSKCVSTIYRITMAFSPTAICCAKFTRNAAGPGARGRGTKRRTRMCFACRATVISRAMSSGSVTGAMTSALPNCVSF